MDPILPTAVLAKFSAMCENCVCGSVGGGSRRLGDKTEAGVCVGVDRTHHLLLEKRVWMFGMCKYVLKDC